MATMANSDNGQGTPSTMMIEVSGLQKIYVMGKTQVHALRGVSLRVPRGEFCCLMGTSGSGKSTLLHLIGGLDRASAGEITVSGQKLSELDENDLAAYRRTCIGFLFQSFNLVSTMTAAQNVEFPMLFARVAAVERRRRAQHLLQAVGLAARVGHKPTELSGGEQQRVALARALVNQPTILLADEPTGNLDSHTGQEIMDIMLRANREAGITILMVTHDPAVARYADRVVRLKDGHVLGEESAENLEKAAAVI
ncbi:ABC transporter ATP-binding protein [Candidatus Amarolinea dominans]|jgi:putative ABC transport system ATP-binding protein|uniref:ABC transporter ATP-binding protein n=2 Tax=Candidatus Amarolinea dominans TaxID=3140696 RepID=UPI0031CC870A